MNNEEYIQNLITEIDTYNKYLEKRAGIMPNEEFSGNIVEDATDEELEKCKTLYKSATKIIDYYIYMKRDTDYINKLYDPTQYMLFLISGALNNYIEIINVFADKTTEYNEMLLDNNIKFNRTLISPSLLYDDYPEKNPFIQKLNNNIKQNPFTLEEIDTISKFSEDDTYVWKYIKLL